MKTYEFIIFPFRLKASIDVIYFVLFYIYVFYIRDKLCNNCKNYWIEPSLILSCISNKKCISSLTKQIYLISGKLIKRFVLKQLNYFFKQLYNYKQNLMQFFVVDYSSEVLPGSCYFWSFYMRFHIYGTEKTCCFCRNVFSDLQSCLFIESIYYTLIRICHMYIFVWWVRFSIASNLGNLQYNDSQPGGGGCGTQGCRKRKEVSGLPPNLKQLPFYWCFTSRGATICL